MPIHWKLIPEEIKGKVCCSSILAILANLYVQMTVGIWRKWRDL